MTARAWIVIFIVALLFALVFGMISISEINKRIARVPKADVPTAPFTGRLSIVSIRDIRVGGYNVVLCGVSSEPRLGPVGLITETARKSYEQSVVTCRPVGSGTPCDGKVGLKFGRALVVQCFTSSGADLAKEFSEKGLLCQLPSQSWAGYVACPSQ